MVQQSNQEQPVQASNERAVAWARQMMARKRDQQKQMVEEYKTNYKLQAALATLREENGKSKHDASAV